MERGCYCPTGVRSHNATKNTSEKKIESEALEAGRPVQNYTI